MAIYFDMDGVLADFRTGVEQLGVPYVPPETTDKKADDAVWDAIRATPGFYAKLPEIPSGIRLFKDLQAAGENPEILTAVPKPHHDIKNAPADKIEWNREHLGPGVTTHICLRAEKQKFCKGPEDILIDDQARNINEWQASGGTGVLFQGAATKLPPRLELKLQIAGEDKNTTQTEPEYA